ncbi:hemogen isoform X4 [Rhinatrema bivittatum]|uniref:hemogen isoform X4 n=1 Tax=Rhinatrema bivittatum TaxID=194408 RepID=UPI00112C7A88|nr:hemogen isoform X4 [Rhinatrema bivittatum]
MHKRKKLPTSLAADSFEKHEVVFNWPLPITLTIKANIRDQNRNKRQKKGRGTGRGRGKRSTKEPEAEVQPEEIPEAKGENGQVHLEYEEEPAVTVPEETSAGTQYETVEDAPQESTALHAEVSERDPESEKPDVLSLPLDSEQAEDDYYIPLL